MTTFGHRRGFALVAFALLIAAGCAFGQAITATLTGTVRDGTGSVVANAGLTLRNEASGDVRKTVTNGEGYYSLTSIPSGSYTLTIEIPGFQTQEQKGIVFTSAEKRNVDATLQVGQTTQTVEVTATAASLSPIDSGEKSSVLNTQALQSIATVGRSAAEFIKHQGEL